MRSSYFQPSFSTPLRATSRGKGLDDIRITPLFVQRTVPQSNAEQDRSSALRICVHPCPSVVVLNGRGLLFFHSPISISAFCFRISASARLYPSVVGRECACSFGAPQSISYVLFHFTRHASVIRTMPAVPPRPCHAVRKTPVNNRSNYE